MTLRSLILLAFSVSLALSAPARSEVDLKALFIQRSDAVDQGNQHALVSLAQMYATGQGTARDLVEAYALAEIAETVLSDIEDTDHGKATALKAQIAPQMSPEQIGLALKRAHERRPDLDYIRRQPERALRDLRVALGILGLAIIVGGILGLGARRLLFRS